MAGGVVGIAVERGGLAVGGGGGNAARRRELAAARNNGKSSVYLMARNHAILSSTVGLLPRCRPTRRGRLRYLHTLALTHPPPATRGPLEKEELIRSAVAAVGVHLASGIILKRSEAYHARAGFAHVHTYVRTQGSATGKRFLILRRVLIVLHLTIVRARTAISSCSAQSFESCLFFFFFRDLSDDENRKN